MRAEVRPTRWATTSATTSCCCPANSSSRTAFVLARLQPSLLSGGRRRRWLRRPYSCRGRYRQRSVHTFPLRLQWSCPPVTGADGTDTVATRRARLADA